MKKLSRGTLIVLAILIAMYLGFKMYTKSFSPSSTANYSSDNLTVRVSYSRPAVKNRLIFGGLVPYEKVWRTGANEATLITFDNDVTFAGEKLKAGTYSLWTIPGTDTWQVIINDQTGQWGTNYDETQDVFRASVNAYEIPEKTELFTISFTDTEDLHMLLTWDKTQVDIPIQ